MSMEFLRKNVIEKCEKHFIVKSLDKVHKTKIHKYILNQVEKYLNSDINVFNAKYSQLKNNETAQKNLVVEWQDKYLSSAYKALFEFDKLNIKKFKDKFNDCLLTDHRVTLNLLNDDDISDKSKDFFCTFLMFQGWNEWQSKTNPSDFTLIFENSSDDKTITQRVEIKNLSKDLNSIPNIQIENFVPRQALIEDLFGLLNVKKNKKISITGISGTGKTFLSKHFVQNYYDSFNHIVWLNCSKGLQDAFTQGNGVKLLDNLGLADELSMFVDKKMDANTLINFAINRLSKAEGFNLLVLDNIDESIYDFEDTIDLGVHWKIIATSQEIIEGFTTFSIPSFYDESKELFYKYYQLEKDDDNLIRLLSAIEYHTLTIELLAKTAKQRQLSIIGLVNRFVEKGINVVEKANVITKHNKERNLTVENIENYLNVIFDTSSLSSEECKVLANIALLQGNTVNCDFFEEIYLSADEDKKAKDILKHTIDILIRKGWIAVESDSIRLHELVKNLLLERFVMDDSLFSSTLEYLKSKTVSAMSSNNFQRMKYFTLCENILANTKNRSSLIVKSIANELSSYYNHLGLHHKSFELFSSYYLLPSNEDQVNVELMKKHKQYAIHLFNQKKYDEALNYNTIIYLFFIQNKQPLINIESTCRYFLDFCQSGFTKIEFVKDEHLALFGYSLLQNLVLFSHATNDIGLILRHKYDFEKSIEMLEFTITYRNILIDGLQMYLNKEEEHLKFSHNYLNECNYFLSITLNNLGLSYQATKQYEKARKAFEDALEIREKILDSQNPNLSTIYHNLSDLFLEMEDLENALEYITKDILLCDDLPENNSFKAQAYHNMSRYEQLAYEKKHPMVMGFINFSERVIHSEIEKFFNKLNLQNQSENIYNTDLILYFNVIAHYYSKFEFYEKAISYFQKELKVKEYSFEKDHFTIGITNYNIATCFLKWGIGRDGYSFIEKAIEIYKKQLPDGDSHFIEADTTRKGIVENCYLQGDKQILELEIDQKIKCSTINLKDPTLNEQVKELLKKSLKDGIIDWKKDMSDTFNEGTIKAYTQKYREQCCAILEQKDNKDLVKKATSFADAIIKLHFQEITNIFVKYNLWKKASEWYYKMIFFQENIMKNEHPLFIGISYYNLGISYFNIQQYELANKHTTKALTIYNSFVEASEQEIDKKELKDLIKKALFNQKSIELEINKYK